MNEVIELINKSIQQNTFVKLTISNNRLSDSSHELATTKNVYFKLTTLKKGLMLSATYRKTTQDITKNYDISEGLNIIKQLLNNTFSQATLFTTSNDANIKITNNKAVIKYSLATFTQTPDREHDKIKQRPLNVDGDYLQLLGVTSSNGKVHAQMQSKYRQINRFIELLSQFLDKLKNQPEINVVDMGSGKGYLTFALYDYIKNILKINVKAQGIELRADLVTTCNNVAKACEFNQLKFIESSINDFDINTTDILIALHACNTATDDAIYKGINANAKLIVVAPCCHKQIRQNMSEIDCNTAVSSIMQYGIFKERQAELLTDTLRALLLETQNYKTSIVEFVNSEHTAKNIMLIAEKRQNKLTNKEIEILQQQIKDLKQVFGIKNHYLEDILIANN